MAISSAIDTLIELATTETDEAAKRLGRITKAAEESEKKLAMLHQYRDDYMARYQASLATGLTAMGMRNFQLFLGKLDTAIDTQQKVVLEVKQRIIVERNAWQASERKRMSYGTLATRAQLKEQHQAIKLDQKQTDEHATRQAFYKR